MSDRRRRGIDLPVLARRGLALVALAFVVEYLVLPQLGGARRALEVVGDVQPLLLGLGVLLQGGAFVAHAQLTRMLLPRDDRPGLGFVTRVELASRAVSHVVPGGTAPGAALEFRLLQRWGVRGADAGFAAATQGIGSALVLHALVWITLAVSIPLRGFHSYYQFAALAGLALVGSFTALVVLLWKGEDRTARAAGAVAERIPAADADRAAGIVHRLRERLDQLRANPGLVSRATGWAALHWTCDAASLWVILAAFGVAPPVDVVVVAFGLASMLSTLPISPRGLGVFEATTITLLVAFGMPRAEAILGVVAYRLVNFWLPIPVGAASYVTVEATLSDERRPVREALGRLGEHVAERMQSFVDWIHERRGDLFGR